MRPPPRSQPPARIPDKPLPRGFNRPPEPGTPRGQGPTPGRFPQGTTPYRATPKGFGRPQVKPATPSPETKPPEFGPPRPEYIKPVEPYYKPIPQGYGPGGFPVSHPAPHTPPQYRDPTGRGTPYGPAFPQLVPNSFLLPQDGEIYRFEAVAEGQVAGGFGVIDDAVSGSIDFEFELYQIDVSSSLGYNVDVYLPYLEYIHPLRGRVREGGSGYLFYKVGSNPKGKINSLVQRQTGQPYFPSSPTQQPPFLAAPPTIAPPPVSIPDTIPPNLPDIYPGLPEPEYPDPPEDEPGAPPPLEPEPDDPDPDPDPEESPSPRKEDEDGDGDISPFLPPPIDPDPFGDEPDFPWKTPDPNPDPDPDPDPTPDPVPTPNPDPKPIPYPVPIPIPGPTPGPDPSPDPKPIPIPVPIPIPGPDPGPIPSPDPKPIPIPVPIPIPGPDPGPTPSPDPKPIPIPVPIPIPGPDPGPTPSPDPKPIPYPGDPGGPINPKPPVSPSPDDFRPRPFDPQLPPPFLPTPPPTPPDYPRPPFPPPIPPFFDDQPKEPNPVNPFDPPDFLPVPKPIPQGQCKTDPCLISIEDAAKGGKEVAQKALEKIDKFVGAAEKYFQILDLAVLYEINDKLGPKLPGGLSKYIDRIDKITKSISSTVGAIQEKVGKFARWARLGQLVNVMTFIAAIHNAYMLSNALGQTVLSMMSNGLAVFGIKDDEGTPYDLSSLINKSVEDTVKSVVGEANYTTMSADFKKANRIYQAAANIFFSIQSLRFSIMGALETIGSWNARIGNALRKWGAVGESAYGWMNPSPNFDNKFTQGIQKVEEVVSQVDSVASETLSAQETVTQIGTQKDELLNSLGLGTEKPLTENQPQKDKATASKAVSVSPNIEATDLVKPGA
jgi:hypothetical protein